MALNGGKIDPILPGESQCCSANFAHILECHLVSDQPVRGAAYPPRSLDLSLAPGCAAGEHAIPLYRELCGPAEQPVGPAAGLKKSTVAGLAGRLRARI